MRIVAVGFLRRSRAVSEDRRSPEVSRGNARKQVETRCCFRRQLAFSSPSRMALLIVDKRIFHRRVAHDVNARTTMKGKRHVVRYSAHCRRCRRSSEDFQTHAQSLACYGRRPTLHKIRTAFGALQGRCARGLGERSHARIDWPQKVECALQCGDSFAAVPTRCRPEHFPFAFVLRLREQEPEVTGDSWSGRGELNP